MSTIKFVVEIVLSTITSIYLISIFVITGMLLFVFLSLAIKKEALGWYYKLIPSSYHNTITNEKKISGARKIISIEREKSKYKLLISDKQ